MLKQCVGSFLLLYCATAPAVTIELKGKASVSGTILEEKSDEIIIDIGYTVLVIPRNQVLKLLNDNEAAAQAIVAPAPASASPSAALQVAPDANAGQGFYRTDAASVQEQSVRDLVKVLGAAVVQ